MRQPCVECPWRGQSGEVNGQVVAAYTPEQSSPGVKVTFSVEVINGPHPCHMDPALKCAGSLAHFMEVDTCPQ